MAKFKTAGLIAVAFVAAICFAENSYAAEKPKNEIPMYGGIPRSPEEQKDDKYLVGNVVKLAGGNRNIAYQNAIDLGWQFFFKGDYAQAMRRFNQAWLIDPEKPAAFHGFGSILLKDGNANEFVKWNRVAADKGYPNAQANMGWAYIEGLGVQKDPAEAAKWYRMAADQGQIDAQKIMAKLYAEGIGVEKNQETAEKWWALAQKEDAAYEAEKQLKAEGEKCAKPLLDKKPKEAYACFESTAEKGDPNSQNALGILYDWGYGVQKDPTKAAHWYEKADAQGFSGGWLGLRKKNYAVPDKNVDVENMTFEDVIDQAQTH